MNRHDSIRAIFFACAFSIAAAAAAADGKRPITHEDVWLMKRVGSPVPSPDGKWVVFPVTEPAYDDNQQMSDLWIVAADGSSAPRRLTFSKSSESGVTWSKDGKRLAFAAKRDGDDVSQVYVLDVSGGGEAVRVTSLTTGARSPQFSPAGNMLLFTSNSYPGARNEEDNKRIAEERKARKFNARVYDAFPIRFWDKWLEDQPPHLFVMPLDAATLSVAATNGATAARAKNLLVGTQLAQQTGFGGRRADTGEEHFDAVWTPDGSAIVFSATTNRNTAAYAFTNTDLFKVSATGGEPERLTPLKSAKGAAAQDSWARPRFSADGKTLYCFNEKRTDRVYNLTRVASFAWPAMDNPRIVTDKLDRDVTSYVVAPDGRVYVLAEESGHENLFAVPAEGGAPETVIALDQGVYTNLAAPDAAMNTVLFANWESSVNPAEVVRIDLDKRTHVPLTSFNVARAAEIDWQAPEHFWFTSKRGRRIHNMIVLPPNFDPGKKYPLFAMIHGGPHSMWRDYFFLRWNYHLLASPGYVILMTNYTGSTGFGEKFAQNIQGDPLATPGDEINQGVDEALKRYKFLDASRMCAGGASYGGHLANWLQASTTRYRCLISHAGLVNLESQWGTSDTIYSREINQGGPVWEQGPIWRKQNPIRYAAKFHTPMLVTVGEQDFRVPLNNSLENWSVLQRMQVPSRLVVFPDENHWVLKGENSKFFYGEVHAWLARWLQPSGGQAVAAQ
jgi:dipeptidyl aminopeptidase/acylaminoacyl peptidase